MLLAGTLSATRIRLGMNTMFTTGAKALALSYGKDLYRLGLIEILVLA